MHDYSSGSRTWRNADDGELAAIEDFRTEYVESIITESEDDELLERYFDGDELAVEEVVSNLMKALYHGSFHPGDPGHHQRCGNRGIARGHRPGLPTPLRWKAPAIATVEGDPVEPGEISVDAPLLAEVIRTTSDPYAGRLSMVRVFNAPCAGHHGAHRRAPGPVLRRKRAR